MAALAVFVAVLVFLLVLLVTGGDLADGSDDILPLGFAIAALLAFSGWWRDRRVDGGRVAAATGRPRATADGGWRCWSRAPMSGPRES
jgi:hypothetical protein